MADGGRVSFENPTGGTAPPRGPTSMQPQASAGSMIPVPPAWGRSTATPSAWSLPIPPGPPTPLPPGPTMPPGPMPLPDWPPPTPPPPTPPFPQQPFPDSGTAPGDPPRLTQQDVDAIDEWMRQNPGVPWETAVSIYRNPEAFERFVQGLQEQQMQEKVAAQNEARAREVAEQGGSARDIYLASIGETPQMPLTPGEAIRRLSSFTPDSFFGLLPSQLELWKSQVSALGVPPDDVIQSILRSFPTAANPGAVTFGSFAEGGRILAG